VAHDFNNLLSVILSYTHFMLDELPPDSPLRADVEQIHRACTRATDLTRQLLAFSRQQVMQPRYLDLSQVIADINKMLQRMLGADIELTLGLASDLDKVRADPSQVEQILMNLAVNARDAMPNGGRLSIETANVTVTTGELSGQLDIAPGRYVTLTVTDNGTGIDAATREHIFEPFFTTKEAGKGTGLGLSTVFGIVKQSGGGIYLDPEHEHGARFRVYLPSVDAERDEPVLPVHIPATLRGTETILLVEDDEQVRTLARAILQRQGYRVLDAQNAGEAFLLCESPETHVDLLLTDLVLPRMNGRELALRLRRTRPQLHVLFMSGYAQDLIDSQTALDQSAFVQKPITPDKLLRKLREVLDATSARPQSTA
jgi:CheY-like chemotaxis protein